MRRLEQTQLEQNQYQNQDQNSEIILGDSPPDYQDEEVQIIKCPPTKSLVLCKNLSMKQYRTLLRPFRQVMQFNPYQNFHIYNIGKRLRNALKKKNKNDPYAVVCRNLMNEIGIQKKSHGISKQIRVIQPISNHNLERYMKKIQVMKKLRALMSIDIGIIERNAQVDNSLAQIQHRIFQPTQPQAIGGQTGNQRKGRKPDSSKQIQSDKSNPGAPQITNITVSKRGHAIIQPVINTSLFTNSNQVELDNQAVQEGFKHIKELMNKNNLNNINQQKPISSVPISQIRIQAPKKPDLNKARLKPGPKPKHGGTLNMSQSVHKIKRPRGRPPQSTPGHAIGHTSSVNDLFKNAIQNKVANDVNNIRQEQSGVKRSNNVCIWRDKLNIKYDMDIKTMIINLQNFFSKMNSLSVDTSNPRVILSESEQAQLKYNVDKSLKWLVEKILNAKMQPIAITVNSQGQNNQDIIEAFQDKRYMSNIFNIIDKQLPLYLTPKFLQYFDFNVAQDRNYLKQRVKFMSAQLGFQAVTCSNKPKANFQFVPFKCLVGNSQWVAQRDKKLGSNYKSPEGLDFNVGICQFYAEYCRELDARGQPISPYKLVRFECTHSHPLTLEYERILLE
ncbi:UNKNOWN [Stylonychia lemnae]|uniref:Uncharacterized protein n=1 Tax=Stylonychia lemnae TaxID=5949 RepID=A0A078AMK3_STYLE|nr:UNKNOWN [Stylonychia lemnae]|eukprot:CDW83156.1 UNKNOWN [Stylonychia lemnae]